MAYKSPRIKISTYLTYVFLSWSTSKLEIPIKPVNNILFSSEYRSNN